MLVTRLVLKEFKLQEYKYIIFYIIWSESSLEFLNNLNKINKEKTIVLIFIFRTLIYVGCDHTYGGDFTKIRACS